MSEKIKTVKEFFNKEKCSCGAIAVYCYMPGHRDENDLFCDDCVPRGCSCEWNHVSEFGPPPEDKLWKWVVIPPGHRTYKEVKEGEMWVTIDEKGREYPCCEYMWSEDGFDIKEDGE